MPPTLPLQQIYLANTLPHLVARVHDVIDVLNTTEIPIANTTVNGIVSFVAQSFGGVKTFTENVAVSQAIVVSGNGSFGGFVNVATTLQVTGISTLIGNAGFGGFANISSTLQVGSTTLLNGALTVNAAATINGALTIVSSLSANGGLGTAGQFLTSGGVGANANWSTPPLANTTANGYMSFAAQSFTGVKTFTSSNVVVDSARLILSPNTTQSPYFMNFGANNTLVGTINSMWFAVDTNSSFHVANNTGTFLLTVKQNGVVSLPIGQLLFPATQNPSTDPNTLDDYEEGTWTPLIGGSTSDSGITYAAQNGYYIKIGKIVVIWLLVALSNKGTINGTVQLKGLPFASENLTQLAPFGIMQWSTLATNWVNVQCFSLNGSTVAFVRGTTAASISNATDLVSTDLQNNSGFFCTMIYRAAA